MSDTLQRPEGREQARLLARGVCRLLEDLGYASLTEFTLASGRRVDVMGLGRDGELLAVEVKSCLADFRADGKWPEYRSWCERLYFAVPPEFPQEVLRAPVRQAIAPARRKAVTLRFARTAGQRLGRLLDPRGAEAV